MISCLSWVPKGMADPIPKRLQVSQAEQEIIDKLQDCSQHELGTGEILSSSKDAEVKVEIKTDDRENSLPADLRMDEYSSDEDEEERLGRVLIGNGPGMDMDEDENDDDDEDQEIYDEYDKNDEDALEGTGADERKKMTMDQDSSSSRSSDDDDDDNLDDVPDTREFMPIDLEGMRAMNLANTDAEYFDDEDEGSDVEDTKIHDSDAIVLVGRTEEDFSALEVHLYDTKTGNLYVHHDITLPSLPLCVAHGDMVGPDLAKGNYCAVGMFSPGIEIWNLDVLDALEPICVLGGISTKRSKRKQKSGLEQLVRGSHTDAIMSLSWNPIQRNMIASGSADCTVKLWDVSAHAEDESGELSAVATFSHHQGKVQSVEWHPSDGSILATGSYDKTVSIVDTRCKDGGNLARTKIPADCEAIAWDPFHTQNITAACEDGTVMCWDVRAKFGSKDGHLWSFIAHEMGGVSDIAYNRHVPGFMATVAVDKTVALWDTHELTKIETNEVPSSCGTKDMKVGKLYSVSFYPSSPWLLGCGGAGGDLALWDMSAETTIHKRFSERTSFTLDTGSSERAEEITDKSIDFQTILQQASAKKVRDKMQKKSKGDKAKKKKVHRR